MLQRRHDDKMKRRPVKRKVKSSKKPVKKQKVFYDKVAFNDDAE